MSSFSTYQLVSVQRGLSQFAEDMNLVTRMWSKEERFKLTELYREYSVPWDPSRVD